MLMSLTSDIPSYEIPGVNVKIPDRQLSRHIFDKDFGSMYGEPEQTVTCMLKNQDTKGYRKERNFNKHKETLWYTWGKPAAGRKWN